MEAIKKRLQVIFTDESWRAVDDATSEANRDFEVGTVSYSDVINEMILNSKIDIKALRTKRTDIRRSLRYFADQENLDVDSVIKTLTELRTKTVRKLPRAQSKDEVKHDE